MIYVDTSALLSIMDVKDNNHAAATECWKEEVGSVNFIINSYSMLETIALVQSRLGLDAVRTLVKEILPIIEVDWLGSDQHEIAINSVLIANRRYLSLVDCSSFETIRRLHIETVFTFDDHFKEQGFTVIP
jgi:predicted nucleic acid-binding protein